jgi:hypothetical protein
VPPVRPSPAVIGEVEAVSVALTQPKGDMSFARISEPQEVWAESGTQRLRVARV